MHKFLKIIKSKSGASLMFVLGLMMLLLAIGVSVLTAASANYIMPLRQREHSRLLILEESVHKNIMHSLQTPGANNLSQAIAYELLNGDRGNEISLDIDFIGVDLPEVMENTEITIEILDVAVNTTEAYNIVVGYVEVDVEEENEDGELVWVKKLEPIYDRIPKTDIVNGDIAVTVTVEINGKRSTSTVTYKYEGTGFNMGGVFEDSTLKYPGEWRLTKYEK